MGWGVGVSCTLLPALHPRPCLACREGTCVARRAPGALDNVWTEEEWGVDSARAPAPEVCPACPAPPPASRSEDVRTGDSGVHRGSLCSCSF